MRALGMGASLAPKGVVGGAKDKDLDKASVLVSESKGKANTKALRGYSGFLALLYAFTEQPNSGEVRVRFFFGLFACLPACLPLRLGRGLGPLPSPPVV